MTSEAASERGFTSQALKDMGDPASEGGTATRSTSPGNQESRTPLVFRDLDLEVGSNLFRDKDNMDLDGLDVSPDDLVRAAHSCHPF